MTPDGGEHEEDEQQKYDNDADQYENHDDHKDDDHDPEEPEGVGVRCVASGDRIIRIKISHSLCEKWSKTVWIRFQIAIQSYLRTSNDGSLSRGFVRRV